jgi:hypothetical protein
MLYLSREFVQTNDNVSTGDVGAVDQLDCAVSLIACGETDDTKALGATSAMLSHDIGVDGVQTVRTEEVLQVLPAGREGQLKKRK